MRTSQIKEDLLKELCSGKTVSGGEFASIHGVSRAAVWKAINSLRAQGYFISGLLNGYSLGTQNTRICGEQLAYTTGENIIFEEETTSTNEDAKKLGESGANEFTIVVARRQTSGKGRLGRSFFAPEGGLYFSVLLRPHTAASNCLNITTAAAVAIAQAIEKVCSKKAGIKWVNDIYIKNKKVCGILTEGVFDAENGNIKYAVLGIGVNVAFPKDGYPQEISRKADSLFEFTSVPSLIYCALLKEFMTAFKAYYSEIEKMPHIEQYRKRSFLIGKTVNYEKEGKTHTAEVCGIGDGAELIVREKGKETALSSGEVRITGYEQ